VLNHANKAHRAQCGCGTTSTRYRKAVHFPGYTEIAQYEIWNDLESSLNCSRPVLSDPYLEASQLQQIGQSVSHVLVVLNQEDRFWADFGLSKCPCFERHPIYWRPESSV
jgi:hypothetical protein